MELRELVPGDVFRLKVEDLPDGRTYEVYERLYDWAFDDAIARPGPDEELPPSRIVCVDCFCPGGVDPHQNGIQDRRFKASTQVEKLEGKIFRS